MAFFFVREHETASLTKRIHNQTHNNLTGGVYFTYIKRQDLTLNTTVDIHTCIDHSRIGGNGVPPPFLEVAIWASG